MSIFVLINALAEVRAEDENPFVTFVKSKLKDEKKPFAVVVEFKVKAGKEKEFEAAFVPFIETTLKEPGCVAFHLNRDAARPEVYLVYEHFKSVAALEEHLKVTHDLALKKAIRPLQNGDVKMTVYTIPDR